MLMVTLSMSLPKLIFVFIFDMVVYIYDRLLLHIGKDPPSTETYMLIVQLQETL